MEARKPQTHPSHIYRRVKRDSQTDNVPPKPYRALARAGINVRLIVQGSSELNIIVGISDDDYEKAIESIYDAFLG